MLFEMLIALALLLGLLLSLESGFRVGRWAKEHREAPSSGQLGAVQGAILGLLGLLLGFSFAGAAGRFLERQDFIVREANAIGTAFLRADLLNEPHRSNLQSTLAAYVSHRLEVSRTLFRGLSKQAESEIAKFHARIWSAARAGVADNPAAAVVVLGPVNDVIDIHSIRMAAGRKHLPGLVLGLLIGCSALAMAAIGYGCGLSGRRYLLMTGALTILIGTALWTTIDLDYPRSGLIRLNDTPLLDLNLRADRPVP
jgi:hypothetical protein